MLGLGGAPDVGHEQPDQHDSIDQRDIALQRQHEGVDGGQRQEGHLDTVAGLQPQRAPEAQCEESDDQRPAKADQQAVGTGHIGRGIGDVGRPFGGGPGEVKIDRVLR